MKLRALRIERLPGIDAPFELGAGEFGEGLHVVHGPNGSGKSSLVRALHALWWPGRIESHAVVVEARFESGGRTWFARRDGREVRWQCDGAPVAPPVLPDAHLAHCWTVGLDDLATDGDEAWFAERVRLAMSDEYDLRGTAQDLFSLGAKHGFNQEDVLRRRRGELLELEREQEQLLESERTLSALDARVQAAAAAAREVAALERALRRAQRAAQRRETELQLRAFPAGMGQLPPDPAALLEELDGEIEAQAARLSKCERELETAERRRVAARLERPLPDGELEPWRARVESLTELEREQRELERDLAEVEARRAAAGEPAADAHDALQPALVALRAWIATPERGGPTPAAWAALALLAAAGVWLGWRVHAAGWLFVLAALALAALLSRRDAGRATRATWVDAYARAGLAPPATWSEAAVALRLSELERELAAAQGARAAVRGDAAGLRARRDELERQRDVLADELCAWLSRCGEEPQPSATALRAALSSLERRSSDCGRALEDLRRIHAERDERVAALELQRGKRARLLATLGLDETRRAEFGVLVERHGAWKALTERARALAADVDEEPADESLSRIDPEELRARLDAARRQAEEHADLLRQAESIRADLRAAGLRASYEEARAAEQRAREDLEQKLEEALDALAGRALLEDVEREHATTARPEILREASQLLRAFTAGRYGLDVVELDGSARLRALDERSPGRSLSPGELSDGTRAQLLLAARLAFVRRHEQGCDLPLFLDDALATSDAARTRAVADSLSALCARDGRQVFVLLRDESDARLVAGADPLARTIDLAAVRAREAPALDRARLAPPPRRVLPSPEGLEPARWAELVGVPPLDPFRGVEAEHVFWLAPTRPELVRRLLELHAERWGALLGLLEAGAEPPIDAQDLAELRRAAQLHEAVRDGWRIGRGERVERETLVAAGVTERYLDGFTELARELRGDARALIKAVEARKDERVKGFHSQVLERVVESLTASGHLDPRESLDTEAAWARLWADVGTRLGFDAPELRRRFEFLRARFDEALAR